MSQAYTHGSMGFQHKEHPSFQEAIEYARVHKVFAKEHVLRDGRWVGRHYQSGATSLDCWFIQPNQGDEHWEEPLPE